MLWEQMTAPEIEATLRQDPVAAVPVGAIEQHGAHLPVDTDLANARAVTIAAAERSRHPVIVAPSLPFGLSPYHRSFAGTISLSLPAYLAVLRDICTGIADAGFRRIALVNGHGGNSAPLRALVSELVSEGIPVATVDYWKPGEAQWQKLLRGPQKFLGHGCELETALQLAILPEAAAGKVMKAAAAQPPRFDPPWVEAGTVDPILPAAAGWAPIFDRNDCGYTGDPASATREAGQQIFEATADALARFFEAFAAARLKVGAAGMREKG